MKQPEGFVLKARENKVYKLVKLLYRLKQAPKQWHQKFDETVLSFGFKLNQADNCVYRKFDGQGNRVIICLYVDDMLIFGTNSVRVQETKEFLSSSFQMKDMGEADVILGIKIIRDGNGIKLSQAHYIEKVLKRFNMFDTTPMSTPMDQHIKLCRHDKELVTQLAYSKVIGSLMYVMTCTRPDMPLWWQS